MKLQQYLEAKVLKPAADPTGYDQKETLWKVVDWIFGNDDSPYRIRQKAFDDNDYPKIHDNNCVLKP